ncbi:para-nitrobenzyl esterase [Colletotrichum orchidophilum]|uniref:Para-nitrobenzyl esterase n=1 Tax=Colletotrichum orchidophilum TaxID=1209926 RepID=A0A1G4BKZ0_9PEZI|nr:para-nitrobenzyl esterase [Colletotrichum orchidophilum]OHF01968.1 para-nitrobenzyl esterase [Colletotrichum orchidophilum]
MWLQKSSSSRTKVCSSVFGSPASPPIPPSEKNLGIHEQRLALTWVVDNIASFGDEPSKVTIWGQSARAFSIDGHLKVYAKDSSTPFRAAIMSIGQMSFRYLAFPSPGIEACTGLLTAVGCANTLGELKCVKAVQAEYLISILSRFRF